jgi:N-acetylmuramoyl-L-alanine amidase
MDPAASRVYRRATRRDPGSADILSASSHVSANRRRGAKMGSMRRSAQQAMPRRATLVGVVLGLMLVAGCGSAHTTTTTVTDQAAVASVTAAPTQTPSNPASSGSAPTTPTVPVPPPAVVVPKPHIIWDPIPFGPERKAQMVAYARRHYGSFMTPTYKLVDPHVIVIHYTETPTFQATYNTFAPDTPDPELHELPNTCAHFVIDKAGVIHQLVPLDVMCRHTVGLNWTAIGIEHVGYGDQEILNDRAQMSASLRLVRWLRCRYHITIRDVVGHNESLSSPYHHEDVSSLRTQTHSDFNHADMQIYRNRLQRSGSCPRD